MQSPLSPRRRSAVAESQLWNSLHLNFVITFLYFLSNYFCPLLLTLAFLLHLPFLWHGCSPARTLPPHEESCPSSTDLKVINEIGLTEKLQDLDLSSEVSSGKNRRWALDSRNPRLILNKHPNGTYVSYQFWVSELSEALEIYMTDSNCSNKISVVGKWIGRGGNTQINQTW